MSNLNIRHAEATDYPAIIRVVDDWWGGRSMADMLPRLFLTHFHPTSFVAESGGELAGFVTGFVSQTDPGLAYLHFVGVNPAFRQQGVGCRLYARFFAAATARGCHTVSCVTSPHNRSSIAFHQAQGFRARDSAEQKDGIPFFKDYDGPGEDRVCFYKALPTPAQQGSACSIS